MNRYYRAFKKVRELSEQNREELIPYIWRQKAEISVICGVSHDFWVLLDYTIGITRDILKTPKETAQTGIQAELKPIFERFNSQLQRTFQKIQDQEFHYIKQELKTFHHILTHTINLIDRNLAHFIPSYLFITLIENMLVAAPLEDKTIDPGLLARRDYAVLIARHISRNFSPVTVELIDHLLYYREISPFLRPVDRAELHRKIAAKIDAALGEKFAYNDSEQYTMQQLIIELREVITASLITEKQIEIMNDLRYLADDKAADADKYINALASLFIQNTSERQRNTTVLRDLSIAILLLNNTLIALESGDKERLSQQLHLARALKEFFTDVTMYLLPESLSLQFAIFLEVMEYLDFLYPSVCMTPDIGQVIRKIRQLFVEETEKISRQETTTISQDEILLFIDKIAKLKARADIRP